MHLVGEALFSMKNYLLFDVLCNCTVLHFFIYIYINLYMNCIVSIFCCGYLHLHCISLNATNRRFNFSLAPECVSVCVGGGIWASRACVCVVLCVFV